jgi:predicted nuclease with TOPRIM domain
MVDTEQSQVRTPPAPPIGEPRGRPGVRSPVVVWLVLVLGIGLGAFGGFRLVSYYGEVNDLRDRLSTVEAERATVEGRAAAIQERVEALSTRPAELDAQLTGMVESLEVYVESYGETVFWFNAAIAAAENGDLPGAKAIADGEFAAAISAAEEALAELQGAFSSVDALLTEVEGAAGSGSPAESEVDG